MRAGPLLLLAAMAAGVIELCHAAAEVAARDVTLPHAERQRDRAAEELERTRAELVEVTLASLSWCERGGPICHRRPPVKVALLRRLEGSDQRP